MSLNQRQDSISWIRLAIDELRNRTNPRTPTVNLANNLAKLDGTQVFTGRNTFEDGTLLGDGSALIIPYHAIGSAGSGDGQLATPSGVAVDVSGNVYVADQGNNRIQKFTGGGDYLTKWGTSGTGNGQFGVLCGIAVFVNSYVYASDLTNHRIQLFINGTYFLKWGTQGSGNGQFVFPQGMAVDAGGNVYVADRGNNRIQKFTSSGTYLTKWGSGGSGDGQFVFPRGVAVDASGNVYVADTDNHRIQKFISGTYLTKWGTFGTGNGQFNYPSGVAVDDSGNVYVADSGNHRIQVFDSDGAYLFKWGTSGSGDRQFDSPADVTVDASGNVYVIDTYNNRVARQSRLSTHRHQAADIDGVAAAWVALGDPNTAKLDTAQTWTAKQTFPIDGTNAPVFRGDSEGNFAALKIYDNSETATLSVMAALAADGEAIFRIGTEVVREDFPGTAGIVKAGAGGVPFTIAAASDLPAHNHTSSGEGGSITIPVVDSARTWTTKQTFPADDTNAPVFTGESSGPSAAFQMVDTAGGTPHTMKVVAETSTNGLTCVMKPGVMVSTDGGGTLAALGTGLLKNTTTTGALSIAAASDLPAHDHTSTGEGGVITPPTRDSLGLDTDDSPQFAGINLGAASDTTLTRTGAGDVAVEGNQLYRAGGTDVAEADGGTGASTLAGAGIVTVVAKSLETISNTGHTPQTLLANAPVGYYRATFMWDVTTAGDPGDMVQMYIHYAAHTDGTHHPTFPIIHPDGTGAEIGYILCDEVRYGQSTTVSFYHALATSAIEHAISFPIREGTPVIVKHLLLEYLGA